MREPLHVVNFSFLLCFSVAGVSIFDLLTFSKLRCHWLSIVGEWDSVSDNQQPWFSPSQFLFRKRENQWRFRFRQKRNLHSKMIFFTHDPILGASPSSHNGNIPRNSASAIVARGASLPQRWPWSLAGPNPSRERATCPSLGRAWLG